MQQINVEQIMAEIRAEIKDKGYMADMLDFENVPFSKKNMADRDFASDGVRQMRKLAFVSWRRPVNRGIRGILKKILYKLTGFIVAPMAEDQTAFNHAAADVVEQLSRADIRQQKEIDLMNRKMENGKRYENYTDADHDFLR